MESFYKTSPIPKPSCNLNDPTNFHPIILLFSLSEVIERILRSQLYEFLHNNNILMPQHFRTNCNTSFLQFYNTRCKIPQRKLYCQNAYCCNPFRHRKAFWQRLALGPHLQINLAKYSVRIFYTLISWRSKILPPH